ncbi:AraC family transcriptional regulator [Clostridium grantii]|nr:AraC family transcriptional regulator [Clostridium grantii]
MCDLGIKVEDFNPKILYTFERKFSEGEKYDNHNHDFLSLIYILSGSCNYIIDDIPYKVKKGDLLIFNKGVYHERCEIFGNDLIEFHLGYENINIKNRCPNKLLDSTQTPIINFLNYDKDFIKCLNEIMAEQQKDDKGKYLTIKTLAMKLIVIILKETYENINTKDKGALNIDKYDKLTIVNTMMEFINENYMEEISLDIISQNMYLSPMYISKLFKDETGETPINYVIKVRLAKALELLKETDISIKEVAKSVGYNDAYHFSKLFKKYYGFPPSKAKR